jgi:hypothetical protein
MSREDDWRRGFALLPIKIGDEWVWLERFWYRPRGEFTEVSLDHPEPSTGRLDTPNPTPVEI